MKEAIILPISLALHFCSPRVRDADLMQRTVSAFLFSVLGIASQQEGLWKRRRLSGSGADSAPAAEEAAGAGDFMSSVSPSWLDCGNGLGGRAWHPSQMALSAPHPPSFCLLRARPSPMTRVLCPMSETALPLVSVEPAVRLTGTDLGGKDTPLWAHPPCSWEALTSPPQLIFSHFFFFFQ